MLKKIIASIFPLIFLSAGLFFLIKAVIPAIVTSFKQRSLVEVRGQLSESNLDWEANDKGQFIYRLTAVYQYKYEGKTYTVQREEIDTRDSVYHYMTKRNKETILSEWSEEPDRVFHIYPTSPEKQYEVQDIGVPFWILLVVLPCLLAFIGLYILVKIFTSKKDDHVELAEPWLQKTNWKSNHISCSTIASNRGMIIVTVFWNLIAFTVLYFVIRESGFKNPLLFFIGVFPLIGIVLIVNIYAKIADLRRNGTATLELNPYPASIGGHFGGLIHFKNAFPKNSIIELKLNCIKVTYSSGNHKSRKESLIWQSTGFAFVNDDLRSAKYRFDIPAGLQQSSLSNDGIHWNVKCTVSYDDNHFERSFEIPVYQTAQISTIEVDSKNNPEGKKHAFQLVNDVTEFTELGTGYIIRYPNFRIMKPFLVFGSLVGLALLTLTFFSLKNDILPLLFTCVVGFFGLVFFLLAIGEGFYTLKVDLNQGGIKVQHKWLGLPFKSKTIAKDEIEGFTVGDYLQSNDGKGSHTAYYKVSVVFMNGQKTSVAIRLRNKVTAEQMQDFFQQYFQENAST